MCVINLREVNEEDLRFRILAIVVGEDRLAHRVDFNEIARNLGITRQLVSYHIKQLVKSGYLLATVNGYAATQKILFLEN